LSLRSKRVPQAQQVPAYLLHLPFIFLLERKLFGYFLVIKSNMNKKVNKDIITNYKDCKYYKKGKEKTALSGCFFIVLSAQAVFNLRPARYLPSVR